MHTPLITGLDIQHTDCVPSTLLGFFLPSNVFGRGQGASLGTVLLLPAPCPAAPLAAQHQVGLFTPALPAPPGYSHSTNPALVAAQTIPAVTNAVSLDTSVLSDSFVAFHKWGTEALQYCKAPSLHCCSTGRKLVPSPLKPTHLSQF